MAEGYEEEIYHLLKHLLSSLQGKGAIQPVTTGPCGVLRIIL